MNISCVLGKDLETYLAKFNDMKVNYDRFSPGIFEQKNATQSPSNLPKVIWEGLVA